MRKLAKIMGTCMLLAALAWFGTVLADRQSLNENVIRLHVVAASDSEEDQQIKLQVRDALIETLQPGMDGLADADAAKEYLMSRLEDLEETANRILTEAGSEDQATVTLAKEAFSTRDYDTFSLPAGVYESLRVTIGQEEGKNWWCVVFPSLCLPATSEGFEDAAAGAGFQDGLTNTLQQEDGYEIRFFFLDCLGWLENLFHKG